MTNNDKNEKIKSEKSKLILINVTRARAPIDQFATVKINYNTKLLRIIAIIWVKFYNVYNQINLDNCFSFVLSRLIVIIVIIGI
jgi:hypothetical protein